MRERHTVNDEEQRPVVDLTLAIAAVRHRMSSQCQSATVLRWIEDDLRLLASANEGAGA